MLLILVEPFFCLASNHKTVGKTMFIKFRVGFLKFDLFKKSYG